MKRRVSKEIIIAIIIGLSILGYGWFNYDAKQQILKQKKRVLEQETLEELDRKASLVICLKEAYDNYILRWNETCKEKGLKVDCFLPLYLVDRYGETRKKDESDCIKMFGK